MDAKTVPVKLSDDIRAIMEERGIREEDIREVLDYAESTGKKLYVEGEERYLAKKKIGNFTCNVEYAVNGGEVEVLNLYSYVILLLQKAPFPLRVPYLPSSMVSALLSSLTTNSPSMNSRPQLGQR